MSGKSLGPRTVRKVSRTGSVVTLNMPEYATGEAKFYRQAHDNLTYVETPGAGLCGAGLNNRFTVAEPLAPGAYPIGG